MAKPPKRIYWDSCCWIALIQKEKIYAADGVTVVEDREALCKVVIEAAKSGAIEIVTSMLTLAEVCRAPDGQADALESFFENDYILLVNMDKFVGERARALMNGGYAGLKPPDATHIATALTVAGVEELHSFDGPVLDLNGLINKDNGEPLKICKPNPGAPPAPLLDPLQNDGQNAPQNQAG